MNLTAQANPSIMLDWTRLRELVRLLAALREIRDPIETPQGLRQAIEVVLQIAALLGLDPKLLERLRAIAAEERTFNLVLAAIQFLLGLIVVDGQTDDGQLRLTANGAPVDQPSIEVDLRSFLDWLPFVLQIIELILRLRGES